MAPKSSSRPARSHDLSIVGDEQERHRIQLEHNLQLNNDLSLHLSSSKDDHSIEYPRHAGHQPPYPAFPSFHHSVENLDPEDQSHIHHWSYRTLDDDDDNAVNPYAAESLSTAAHHASALTFTAGLGAHRRDQTQSGVEYDPDRPLHNMIAGVDSKLSMFGNTQSRSHNLTSGQLMFDPLVVDDSAQLDRVLNTGRNPSHISPAHLRSPLASSSSSSSSSSSISSPNLPRPKLSDALHRVAFSPKRPRSAQSLVSPRAARNSPRHAPSPSLAKVNFDIPTPRARSKTTSQPLFNVHPPTPSSVTSKFTKVARGLAREIEVEQNRIGRMDDQDVAMMHSTVRDRSRTKGRRGPVKPTPKGRVYLPDVTGLTSAVESPAKGRLDYHRYDAHDDWECDARILATLSVVQSKLAFLESENSVSRRRVKELELELEACKKEVARERTRVLAMEMEDVERQHSATIKAHEERKGKAKASTSWDEPSRYREAVEEKKALESLIISLRSHLSRLTSELSSHQALLTELRSLRDADARALQAKSEEVDLLREQVERLAGEVEVLKGVVEEGLKERRMVREQSLLSHNADENPEAQEHQSSPGRPDEDETQKANEADQYLFSADISPSRTPPKSTAHAFEKTMRTDYATVGSSQMGGQNIKPFISREEVERLSFELDERRSTRSISPSVPSSVGSQTRSLSYAQPQLDSRPQSPSPQNSLLRSSTSSRQGNQTTGRPLSPDIMMPSEPVPRPSAPTPAHALSHGQTSRKQKVPSDKYPVTPFPQIRGEKLERLFFSAPEHNVDTCTVCQRRRRRDGRERTLSWLPSRFRATNAQEISDDDEGFAEGDDHDHPFAHGKGKGRETVHFADLQKNGDRNKLPPQTVLARVLRELEDDFTHYKGIYVELSDQYKLMDAISNVAKRNVLAEHLREVIDILEQRGDQIASLYDLLTFEDKAMRQPTQDGSGARLKKHSTVV